MKRNRHGFTLTELLVVIAIIAILAGLLLGATLLSQSKAKVARCKAALKGFSDAIDTYRFDWELAYPDFLSNLFPKYYGSAPGYVCPADWSKGKDGSVPDTVRGTDTKFMSGFQYPSTNDISSNHNRLRNKDIEVCSYLYQFCGANCGWASGTWREAMEKKRKEYGEKVPLIRCFWHGAQKKDGSGFESAARIINISVGTKAIYFSGFDWEAEM